MRQGLGRGDDVMRGTRGVAALGARAGARGGRLEPKVSYGVARWSGAVECRHWDQGMEIATGEGD